MAFRVISRDGCDILMLGCAWLLANKMLHHTNSGRKRIAHVIVLIGITRANALRLFCPPDIPQILFSRAYVCLLSPLHCIWRLQCPLARPTGGISWVSACPSEAFSHHESFQVSPTFVRPCPLTTRLQ